MEMTFCSFSCFSSYYIQTTKEIILGSVGLSKKPRGNKVTYGGPLAAKAIILLSRVKIRREGVLVIKSKFNGKHYFLKWKKVINLL